MLNWAFLFTVQRDTQKLHKSQQKLYLVSIHSQRTNKQLFTVKVKVSNTVTERSIHRYGMKSANGANVKSSQVRLVEEVVGGVCTVSARDVDRGRWYLNNIHINTCMRIHARVLHGFMPIGSCWQIGHVCRVSCGFNVVWNRALEPHSEARVAASNSKASADPRIPCHENARASRVNRLTAD